MNQVDYKKKYNEALERMKSWARGEHPECFTEARKAAEFIFPELAESEDEKIRKELIHFFKNHMDSVYEEISDNNVVIAWLEKQGEQNPTLSEEDERMFDSIIEDFMPYGECPDYPTDEEREYCYEGYRKVEWLKLLKERFKNV